MNNDLRDKIARETRRFADVIAAKLSTNLTARGSELKVPTAVLQQLLDIAAASVEEGYHQAYPGYERKVEELAPENAIPLIMERIPRRRHK